MTTLPQQETIVQYIADGVTTNYVVPFYTPISTIDESPAIDVYVTLSGQTPVPADNIQTWGVNYTYTPNSDPLTGGFVVFLAGSIPPSGATVTFSRDVPAELTVDFSEAQNFSGANLDDVLLQLLMITQQNKTFATQRNLSYIVNSLLPDAIIQANTQIPVLMNGQIWYGVGTGVIAVTLEQSSDVSTLRSELANNSPGTDGALIVGYNDPVALAATTVHAQLALLTARQQIFGSDTGAINAMVLTISGNPTTYYPGMQITIIPANTNNAPATINFNGLGVKNIVRPGNIATQPQDIVQGYLLQLIYDGTSFIIQNFSSIPSGTMPDFGGGGVPIGFLSCNGSIVSRTLYSAIFAAIGVSWGAGDGMTTFALPNLARSTKVGSGGTGTAILGSTVGDQGGAETYTQTTANLPPHTHNLTPYSPNTASSGSGVSAFSATGSITTTSTGNGVAHTIVQPSSVVNMIIKI